MPTLSPHEDLAARLAAWARAQCAGPGRVRVEADVVDGLIESLSVAWKPTGGVGARPQTPWEDLILTEAQSCVIEALEGVALRGRDLEPACGLEHSHMFRVLRQLQALDPPLVARDPALGYYRTDAPPAELAGRDDR